MNPPVPNRRYQSEFAIQQKYYHETADDYDPMHLPANEEYDLASPILPSSITTK